jgi:hypothetical protein
MSGELALHERMLSALGLGHPSVRAMTAFTATNALILLTKPDWAFDRNGNPRPWVVTQSGKYRIEASWCPWYVPGFLAAAFFGLLV